MRFSLRKMEVEAPETSVETAPQHRYKKTCNLEFGTEAGHHQGGVPNGQADLARSYLVRRSRRAGQLDVALPFSCYTFPEIPTFLALP
jgi:hypothetical protein